MTEEQSNEELRQKRLAYMVECGFSGAHAEHIDKAAQDAVRAAMNAWSAAVMDPSHPTGTGAAIAELAIQWLINEVEATRQMMIRTRAEAAQKIDDMPLKDVVAELETMGAKVVFVNAGDLTCDCEVCTLARKQGLGGTLH